MVKTQEELNQLKNEYDTLKNKLKELTEEELRQVTGGSTFFIDDQQYDDWKNEKEVPTEPGNYKLGLK